MPNSGPWASQQIAEFLSAVSSLPDETAAITSGLERAAEALEAEIAFYSLGDVIEASIGFRRGKVPSNLRPSMAEGANGTIELDPYGTCYTTVAELEKGKGESLVVIRSGGPFDPDEISLIRSMARVLEITLKSMRGMAHERFLHMQLSEREQLLEKLARIQRSISHRAPLQEVLDAITSGAKDLLNDDVVGLRLIDDDDPTQAILVSTDGTAIEFLTKTTKISLQEGAGGRAILEQRLVVIEDYPNSPFAIGAFTENEVRAAMAAPVYENGRIAGSLLVASRTVRRMYSDSEREMLVALAEHASLALTDAKIVDAMREAERSKEMFLAMVSHELKTPLTVIMGVLLTLKGNIDRLPIGTRDELMESAYARTRDLERLIEMLLRGARAQLAGAKELVRVPAMMHQALAGFNASRPIRMDLIPDVNMFADPASFRQILGILLENAISHSPAGSAIDISTSSQNDRLLIEISNEGSLPPEMKPRELFMPFHRGSGANSPGVGLGLYVAHKLAESMEGVLDARSDGKRVTFSFTCPLGTKADVRSNRAEEIHPDAAR